jgi:hypothetical protein
LRTQRLDGDRVANAKEGSGSCSVLGQRKKKMLAAVSQIRKGERIKWALPLRIPFYGEGAELPVMIINETAHVTHVPHSAQVVRNQAQ